MHALSGPSGAVCFVVALRSLWLLPDWLAKWQCLVACRRALRRRDQAARAAERAGPGGAGPASPLPGAADGEAEHADRDLRGGLSPTTCSARVD